ncbi:MAG TPA: DHH family phosphoesterase [Bacteroidales bacterium]|nr:DHH family phosphoesterase [Bacteroidales bacterium]
METTFIKEVQEKLNAAKNIVVISHNNPDGDAVGSVLAMWLYLKKKYHAIAILPNDFPDFYKWMPGAESIKIGNKSKEECAELLANADLIFCLDFNSPDRVGGLAHDLRISKAEKILIDHHLFPSDFFKIKYTRPETSSTTELVYEVIAGLGDEAVIDYDIAVAVYVGIITDTGSFSHSSSYPGTYLITSKLIEIGIDPAEIQHKVFCNFSESRVRLLGYCLSEKLTIIEKYSTAYIVINKDDMKRFHFKIGDSEGIVNYGLTIKNIRLAALFTEKNGMVKLSLRSTGELDVDKFARKHFSGAGHLRASGADIKKSLEESVEEFISLLPLYEKELTSR